MSDEPFSDVDVVAGERFGGLGGVALEEEIRLVARVGERASEDEFPARNGFFGLADVVSANEATPLEVVLGEVIDEQIVHGCLQDSRWALGNINL